MNRGAGKYRAWSGTTTQGPFKVQRDPASEDRMKARGMGVDCCKPEAGVKWREQAMWESWPSVRCRGKLWWGHWQNVSSSQVKTRAETAKDSGNEIEATEIAEVGDSREF